MSQLPITRVPTSSIRRLEYPFLTSYCLLVLEQMSMLFVGMISTDSRLWAGRVLRSWRLATHLAPGIPLRHFSPSLYLAREYVG